MDKELINMLKMHEGYAAKPYKCSVGKSTIGYGRNLDDNGITREEAEVLLNSDIRSATHDAVVFIPPLYELSDNRQMAIIDMSFNLGYNRLSGFKKLRRAILNKDYTQAAKEMLNSKWATQVGNRATRLAVLMEEG